MKLFRKVMSAVLAGMLSLTVLAGCSGGPAIDTSLPATDAALQAMNSCRVEEKGMTALENKYEAEAKMVLDAYAISNPLKKDDAKALDKQLKAAGVTVLGGELGTGHVDADLPASSAGVIVYNVSEMAYLQGVRSRSVANDQYGNASGQIGIGVASRVINGKTCIVVVTAQNR